MMCSIVLYNHAEKSKREKSKKRPKGIQKTLNPLYSRIKNLSQKSGFVSLLIILFSVIKKYQNPQSCSRVAAFLTDRPHYIGPSPHGSNNLSLIQEVLSIYKQSISLPPYPILSSVPWKIFSAYHLTDFTGQIFLIAKILSGTPYNIHLLLILHTSNFATAKCQQAMRFIYWCSDSAFGS